MISKKKYGLLRSLLFDIVRFCQHIEINFTIDDSSDYFLNSILRDSQIIIDALGAEDNEYMITASIRRRIRFLLHNAVYFNKYLKRHNIIALASDQMESAAFELRDVAMPNNRPRFKM